MIRASLSSLPMMLTTPSTNGDSPRFAVAVERSYQLDEREKLLQQSLSQLNQLVLPSLQSSGSRRECRISMVETLTLLE